MDDTLPSAQRVYAATKELILSGRLAGGSLLSEGEVARRLHVSRTPAREAFVRLEAEGLLSLLPRRGAVVTPMTPADMVDLLEVREALEVAAVRRLAGRADRADRDRALAGARRELAGQADHAATLDLDAFSVSDQRFHRAIVDAAGNALASRLYASLGDRQRRMTAGAVGTDLHRLADLLGEHRGLLKAAEQGDTDGFSQDLRRHFESTHRVLLGP